MGHSISSQYQPTHPQPIAPKGFSHINRYWDKMHDTNAAKILPGEYYVTTHPDEVIATTLGSCVSACIRDKVFGIGGMNHFMLPGKISKTDIFRIKFFRILPELLMAMDLVDRE